MCGLDVKMDTSYLQCVTGEVRLLVPPDALRGNNQHHDPENKKHREPDFTQAGGMTVRPDQLSVQSGPRHPGGKDSDKGMGMLALQNRDSSAYSFAFLVITRSCLSATFTASTRLTHGHRFQISDLQGSQWQTMKAETVAEQKTSLKEDGMKRNESERRRGEGPLPAFM